MVPEKSPVVETKANGEVEGCIQTAQGQVNTSKMALETAHQGKTAAYYITMVGNVRCNVTEQLQRRRRLA